MKRYCKATLNIFFNEKKNLMIAKIIIYRINFLCLIEILLLNMHVKIVKNSIDFCSKFQVFPAFFQNFINSRYFQVK